MFGVGEQLLSWQWLGRHSSPSPSSLADYPAALSCICLLTDICMLSSPFTNGDSAKVTFDCPGSHWHWLPVHIMRAHQSEPAFTILIRVQLILLPNGTSKNDKASKTSQSYENCDNGGYLMTKAWHTATNPFWPKFSVTRKFDPEPFNIHIDKWFDTIF